MKNVYRMVQFIWKCKEKFFPKGGEVKCVILADM